MEDKIEKKICSLTKVCGQEKEKKRVEKNLEIAKKKGETARKNKENKERREFEKLKKKFGD